ncbi:MAG: ATPase domain-containing protein [Planctomycetaceae bacterium]
MTKIPHVVRFGIPTLDRLLGVVRSDSEGNERDTYGISVKPIADQNVVDTISLCVIGADGVGKSLLALHLASRYRSDATNILKALAAGKAKTSQVECGVCPHVSPAPVGPNPFIVYASTDLSYGRALRTWESFALQYPDARIEDPFDYADALPKHYQPCNPNEKVHLKEFVPLKQDFPGEQKSGEVYFLDLATHTSGDDWAYLNRLVASLPQPEDNQPRHLLVVDAVEGLEVLVGSTDAFGQNRDRRSRVAQLLRTAAGKCHVILLVEKQKGGEKVPEEFIADAVISLGEAMDGNYSRRTIEVEKVRGQSHVRGHHEITVRSGCGTSTGGRFNADDPFVPHPESPRSLEPKQYADFVCNFDAVPKAGTPTRRSQAYIYVFHSLHFLHRQIMDDRSDIELDESVGTVSSFGITHLDEILIREEDLGHWRGGGHHSEKGLGKKPLRVHSGRRGLPSAEPTALIGEDGTYKSKLSKAFLAQAAIPDDEKKQGVAVLITTKTLDEGGLKTRLSEHVQRDRLGGRDVLCRRLEVHHVSSSICMHILRQAVRRAQLAYLCKEKGMGEFDLHDVSDNANNRARELTRRKFGAHIRLVIDNWTAINDLYPPVKNDPLFWPSVMFFLRREGIATLLVASEPIGFSRDFRLSQTVKLQDLTSVQLFTWRVPFYGESRVAITVTPPLQIDGRGTVIRELRLLKAIAAPPPGDHHVNHRRSIPDKNSGRIAVNPTFELYDGLEQGTPQYVPLQVWLYAGTGRNDYLNDIRPMVHMLLAHVPRPTEVSHGGIRLPDEDEADKKATNRDNSQPKGSNDDDSNQGISGVRSRSEYSTLREFCELQGIGRFRYTLVMQVDEYWAETNHLQFSPMQDYLSRATSMIEFLGNSDPRDAKVRKQFISEDPFSLWQPSQSDLDRWEKSPYELNSSSHMVDEDDRTYQAISRRTLMTTVGYRLPQEDSTRHFSKVPYCWDFGFLMLDSEKWQNQLEGVPITASKNAAACSCKYHSVQQIVVEGKTPERQNASWLEFATDAWAICNQGNKKNRSGNLVPLMVAPEEQETLACLFLEIWVSQIEQYRRSDAELDFLLTRDRMPHRNSLVELIRKYRKEAVEAILLLSSLIPASMINDENELLPCSEVLKTCRPIAIRMWYSSTPWLNSLEQKTALEGNSGVASNKSPVFTSEFIATQLPGTRITRGDWFLSIARGSRSILMGERAIDLLTSRRANITRLQNGIGLPVRDSGPESPHKRELWTTLRHLSHEEAAKSTDSRALVHEHDGQARPRVRYDELLKIAPVQEPRDQDSPAWLWRSRIAQYDRHSRLFRRWICAMLKRMPEIVTSSKKSPLNADRDPCLQLFDELVQTGNISSGPAKIITEYLDDFAESLQRATVAPWDDVEA